LLRLADLQQAGRCFCGHSILPPESVPADSGPILLTPAAARTREAMRIAATARGIDPARLVDPYE
jgi:hypothetical protein